MLESLERNCNIIFKPKKLYITTGEYCIAQKSAQSYFCFNILMVDTSLQLNRRRTQTQTVKLVDY